MCHQNNQHDEFKSILNKIYIFEQKHKDLSNIVLFHNIGISDQLQHKHSISLYNHVCVKSMLKYNVS